MVLSPGVVLLAGQHGEPPERALVSQLPSDCNLFSRPGMAGVVVLLRPDVLVWMDGRADFFGREMLLLSGVYYGGAGTDPVPEGTTCVLLDLSKDVAPGLEERLRSSPEWRLEAAEGSYEIWLPTRAG